MPPATTAREFGSFMSGMARFSSSIWKAASEAFTAPSRNSPLMPSSCCLPSIGSMMLLLMSRLLTGCGLNTSA
ncbi:hypothetical protein D9M71_589410 [compost metagenome]